MSLNLKEKTVRKSQLLFAAAVVALFASATIAAAQSDAARSVYERSATIPTNIAGIRTFPEPPAGFNALTASDETLAAYGIPPRPDRTADAEGYAKWAKVMTSGAKRWNGELRPRQAHNTPMRPVKVAFGAAGAYGDTKFGTSSNWSGVVNTNSLTSYSTTKSYYYIFSEFNVPVAQQAFNGAGGNICDGGWDIASVWNGIDGFSNGDVLQGGVDSGYYCDGGSTDTLYASWIEWYPAGSTYEYNVNPGDDMYVETWNTSDTNGYVALYDLTLQIYATYNLTAPSGTTLVGNSAEFIVERPCCRGSYLYPLSNYVADFWDYSGDFTFSGAFNDPGATGKATWQLGMTDDAGDQVISLPDGVTTWNTDQNLKNGGLFGKYSIFFQDENCAYLDGCTF
jgi:Peptidase A4 family